MAAFRGVHVSPWKHSYTWLPDGQTPYNVIPMCQYASQATQKVMINIIASPKGNNNPPNNVKSHT